MQLLITPHSKVNSKGPEEARPAASVPPPPTQWQSSLDHSHSFSTWLSAGSFKDVKLPLLLQLL